MRLSRQTLIISMLPLLLGLTSSFWMAGLLSSEKKTASAEAATREIFEISGRLIKEFVEAALFIAMYASTREDLLLVRVRSSLDSADSDTRALCALAKNRPEMQKGIKRLLEIRTDVDGVFTEYLDIATQGRSIGPLQVLVLRDRMKVNIAEFSAQIDEFRHDALKKLTKLRAEQEASKNAIYASLTAWFLASLAISIFSSLFTSKRIITRLDVMLDNVGLLEKGASLNKVLVGEDEIAQLDQAFHKMSAALAESARKEKALVENAGDVIGSLDPELNFVRLNQACVTVFGYAAEELMTQSLSTLVVDRDIAELKKTLEAGRDEGLSGLELTLKHKDGKTLYSIWSITWSFQDSTYFFVAHDITERRIAEKLLQESEQRFRLISERIPAGLLVLDQEGSILSANAMAKKLLSEASAGELIEGEVTEGAVISDLVGSNFSQYWSVDSDLAADKKLILLKQKSLGRVSDEEIRSSDGRKLRVELSIDEMESHGLRQLLVILLDVTERYENLAIREQLMNMVVHDIRSPLTSIATTLDALQMGLFGNIAEKMGSKLGACVNESNRIIRLINDLLRLARHEQTKLVLELASIDLLQIVNTSVESIQQSLVPKNISIVKDLDPKIEDIHLVADADRITQVLVNLFTNAIKFTPTSSKLTVQAQLEGKAVRVSVKDEGPGVPEGKEVDIFLPYKQVSWKDSVEKGGTGLGLAICKEIIDDHGGRMGVTNSPEGGACFWFYLPVFGSETSKSSI